MTRMCPICNFEVKSFESENNNLTYNCHGCGEFTITKQCADRFRMKYMSFDVSTVMGSELYKTNMTVLRSFIAHDHKEPLNDEIVANLPGFYRPYPSNYKG